MKSAKSCYKKKMPSAVKGASKEKLYAVLAGIKRRVGDPNHQAYKNYGGRGITLCAEWNDYTVFRDWAIKNGYREGLTIERNDNNEGYCPENCSWKTRMEQSRNRRTSVFITHNGEAKTLPQWCEEMGLNLNTLTTRLYRHYHKTGEKKLILK